MTPRERETFAEQMVAMLDGVQPGLDDLKVRASRAAGEEAQLINEQLAMLRDREKTIRHQLGQLLGGASDAAVRDLEHGLLIAWERFARDVALAHWKDPFTQDGIETRTNEIPSN